MENAGDDLRDEVFAGRIAPHIPDAINNCSAPWNYYEAEIEAELSLELLWLDYLLIPTVCSMREIQRARYPQIAVTALKRTIIW